MTTEERYMKAAIKQAKKAENIDEVPIGCVIVYHGKIIARGYNRRNIDKNTLSHAELNAIKKASKRLGDWRLDDCEMYVTLEPCQMCAGAIVQSRIKKVYCYRSKNLITRWKLSRGFYRRNVVKCYQIFLKICENVKKMKRTWKKCNKEIQ